MEKIPKIKVTDISFSVIKTETRFPFRYGIAAMTEAPHWFVHSVVEVDGKPSKGTAAEGLPPKWFTKNPDTTFEEDDLPGMERVIRQAADFAGQIDKPLSFFHFWQELKKCQDEWATKEGIAPLLSQLGVALMERTVLDAFCKAVDQPLHRVVKNDLLGIEAGAINPELKGFALSDAFRPSPQKSLKIRHTVGLSDPLTDSDITDEDRADDGLPQSLEANIQKYGLDHFKIKLCGQLEKDRDRCKELARLFEKVIPSGNYFFTLDGNEQYQDIETFRDHYESLYSTPELASLVPNLLFVEQPIHRDYALIDSVKKGIDTWQGAPPIIIDESDASVDCLSRALSLGYSGTSHKNCKGIVKSLINTALLKKRGSGILSAEDLANTGPFALLQDLAVVALLGIPHVERNGHHYFAGLSMFPDRMQQSILENHSDLYHKSEAGFPTLTIEKGSIAIDSINRAPFGTFLN